MQREGAARQSSKIVSWPNSVLVAPLRVALQSYSVATLGVTRPKGAATPPSEKCSPYWAWAHNGAAEGICRANTTGATGPICRANVRPSPVRTAFFTWRPGRSLWSRHYQWRDRVGLSRYPEWRVKHRIRLPWQVLLVAPLTVVLQSRFVAPHGMARQAQNSAS